MTSSNGTIFRVTGPLCGEFTGPGEFPAQWPVTRSFDVFFDQHLNKRLSKQPWAGDLRRHCGYHVMEFKSRENSTTQSNSVVSTFPDDDPVLMIYMTIFVPSSLPHLCFICRNPVFWNLFYTNEGDVRCDTRWHDSGHWVTFSAIYFSAQIVTRQPIANFAWCQ